MGRRYYCDYCDKSFADNPVNRKTHLTGNAHLQSRKAHYDTLRGEKEILNDDKNKKPCRAYLSTGECKFGERCQYSHLTNEDRARLSEVIAKKEESVQARLKDQSNSKADFKESLDKWVEKRNKKRKFDNSQKDETVKVKKREIHVSEYKLADCLVGCPSIPPSLLPPTKEGIQNSDYEEWGW